MSITLHARRTGNPIEFPSEITLAQRDALLTALGFPTENSGIRTITVGMYAVEVERFAFGPDGALVIDNDRNARLDIINIPIRREGDAS